ncbi:MAG: cytochrome P450, partial [Sphingorhabdus sp.]
MANKADINVNLFDAETQKCPYDAYKTLRDEAPVYKQPGTDIYVVSRYEDVRRILLDPATFPSSPKKFAAFNKTGATERQQVVQQRFVEKGWLPEPTLSSRDDPNHKQMRAMFNEAFKPSKIKTMDPLVETLAYELIDGFIEDGQCNWVSQFAVPLPLYIIGEQMGAPREDMWKIKRWTDAFFHRISMMLDEDAELEMVDREIEGQHYFNPVFERLRKNPDDSLLSELVNRVIEEWG